VITNSGGSAVTLTVGNNNASGIYGGTIANGANALSLTKIGSGTETLSGINTYNGNTAISGGTLALSGAGSIGNSPNISIAGNATLDVSGLSSSFVLGASQTLGNSSSTAVLNGSASTGSGTVSLTFASGTPSLMVTNGTLTLSVGTTFNVNNTGAALIAGSYTIISAATTGNVGSVAGTAPASVIVSGGGLAAGTTATLQISGGQLNLVVSANAPSTPHITGINLNGTTLSIAATNGGAGNNWTLLQSTNVALPLSQWQTNLTGMFDNNGNLSTNIANTVSNSQEFYILKQ
jgi:autotransporter-associated beta strand protein